MEPKHNQLTPLENLRKITWGKSLDSPVVSAVSWEVRVKGTEESGNGRVWCAQRVPAKQIWEGQTLLIILCKLSWHSRESGNSGSVARHADKANPWSIQMCQRCEHLTLQSVLKALQHHLLFKAGVTIHKY